MITKFILTLLNVPGFGRKTVEHIMADSWIEGISLSGVLLDLIRASAGRNPRIKVPTSQEINIAIEKAENIIEESESKGVKIINYQDSSFPHTLKEIPEKPLLLHVKGNPDTLKNERAIAMVGTRNPTEWGFRAGRKLAKIFAEKGYIVVSGLAKGCDTSAHMGCLDGNGKTVAVMASGLDYIYPKENKRLADEIIEKGGCLISEYSIGEKPQKSYFTARDRLQSGLSKGLIVIETGYRGGTMHTVNYAIEQRRKLACITGHPVEFLKSETIKGSYSLINKQVALSVGSPKEINTFLRLLSTKPVISNISYKGEAKRVTGNSRLFDARDNI